MVWRHRFRSIRETYDTDKEASKQMELELLHVFEDVSDLLPENPEPPWLVATTYSIRKEFSQSLEFLEEVRFRAEATSTPEQWLGDEYWFDVAAALERSGKLEEAEKTFLGVIEKNPEHHTSLNYLAYMWAEQGENLDQALEFVQRAMRLDPDNGSYIDTLGWIYYMQGEFEKAYRQLLRSAELLPDESVVLEHLGDVLMKLGRPVEARGYYRIALVLDPAERLDIVLDSLEVAERAVAELVTASVISQ
jgi:tetratricopeptide (TPR) repeat protein